MPSIVVVYDFAVSYNIPAEPYFDLPASWWLTSHPGQLKSGHPSVGRQYEYWL